MSNYNLNSSHPFSLMKGRLGVYSKNDFNADINQLDGVEHQNTRLEQHGGNLQQERMIRDKRRSLDRALWNSYQAAEVIKVDAQNQKPVRALINPNKTKQDYDDKILSIGFEHGFQPGDVFEWKGTNTHWLIYLQDLTELAYFKGDIRKCSYQIAWENENGEKCSIYAAIRGPVETKVNFIQKHEISIDNPNYSLSILMPKNDETIKYFKRYSKFYLQDDNVCWQVEAIDWISTPGILEVIAIEYYANKDEDDIQNGIVGGLIIEPENPNTQEEERTILGETFIKVKKSYEYSFNGIVNGEWKVDNKYPVKIIIDPENSKKITLKWDSPYSGQFELYYGNYSKTIVVESLF